MESVNTVDCSVFPILSKIGFHNLKFRVLFTREKKKSKSEILETGCNKTLGFHPTIAWKWKFPNGNRS